jgi:hypothetical protein
LTGGVKERGVAGRRIESVIGTEVVLLEHLVDHLAAVAAE